jgi:hypothetical protein
MKTLHKPSVLSATKHSTVKLALHMNAVFKSLVMLQRILHSTIRKVGMCYYYVLCNSANCVGLDIYLLQIKICFKAAHSEQLLFLYFTKYS